MFNLIDIAQQKNYESITTELRYFFKERGYTEVYCQGTMKILAACEDPETIAQTIFKGKNLPLPQTNQMNLETILLTNPAVEKVFTFTTSYRDEPFPIEGRHDTDPFLMFEFEGLGDIDNLVEIEADLLWELGLGFSNYQEYNNLCHLYQTETLTADHETLMQRDFGNAVSLSKFPQRSHPFWNMKKKDGTYNKIDVILYGMETIGSAERSCNPAEMRENFMTISDGKYAKLLFAKCGEQETIAELDKYLALPMFPRFGGGIGIGRLERAMKLAGLL